MVENKRTTKNDKLDASAQVKTLLEVAVLNSRVMLDRREAKGELVPMGDRWAFASCIILGLPLLFIYP